MSSYAWSLIKFVEDSVFKVSFDIYASLRNNHIEQAIEAVSESSDLSTRTKIKDALFNSLRLAANNKMNIFLLSVGGGAAYMYHSSSQQQKKAEMQLTEERISTFFNNTQATCDQTTILFLKQNLEDKLNSAISSPTTAEIRSAPPEQRHQLMDQLKIATYTKLLATLYIMPLLLLFIRVQINLVGRYCYLDRILCQTTTGASADSDSQTDSRPIDMETENRFFSISKIIIEKRFDEFVQTINEQVTCVLQDYRIDQQVDYEELLKIFVKIRSKFENKQVLSSLDNADCLTRYLMPDNDEYYDSLLLNEAKNIFENRKFNDVIQESINCTFRIFYDMLRNEIGQQRVHIISLVPRLIKLLDQLIKNDLDSTVGQIVAQTESINRCNREILTNNAV
ncbi:hypothetical protein SAMD00019534_076940, partial [Acytostelium subglobosum LB1]|uniref:hypothetical protein n=1 Tax=Acytostelium subglobosum LB1 TaxID=1410327 RepID=UPI000644E82A